MAITTRQTTSAPDLPERARSLEPLLNQHADAAEKAGRLADEVVEGLHRERLWGMLTAEEMKQVRDALTKRFSL